MENKASVSIKRIILLIKKTLTESGKYAIIVIITVLGLFSVFILINMLLGWTIVKSMYPYYKTGFLISGFFISGMAFRNLRTKEKATSYLALPASLVEKTIAEIFLTTVGFAILYTILFYIFNFIFYFLWPVRFVNILDGDVLKTIKYYLILQSLFLAGAATFRKAPVFYSAFVIFIAGIILLIIAFSLIRVLSMIVINSEIEYFTSQALNDLLEVSKHKDDLLFQIPIFLFTYFTAPVFWIVTYLKLKEKEV